MGAIEEGKAKITFGICRDTHKEGRHTYLISIGKAKDILEQTANAKAVEELEKAVEKGWVTAGVFHIDAEYVINRIKELQSSN